MVKTSALCNREKRGNELKMCSHSMYLEFSRISSQMSKLVGGMDSNEPLHTVFLQFIRYSKRCLRNFNADKYKKYKMA